MNSSLLPDGLALAVGNDAHMALAAGTLGLVITPSDLLVAVWGGMDAHIVLGRRPLAPFHIVLGRRPAGFAYGTMSTNIDFWVRELSRAGLPAPAQQARLRRLAWTIETGTKYFPDSPQAYVGSMKELLLSTFLPQAPFALGSYCECSRLVLGSFSAQQSMGIGIFGTFHVRRGKPPTE